MKKCRCLPQITRDGNVSFRDINFCHFRLAGPAFISGPFLAWQEEINIFEWKRIHGPVLIYLFTHGFTQRG